MISPRKTSIRGQALYGVAWKAQAPPWSVAKRFAVTIRRQIFKARIFADKRHMHSTDRSVTLLADNQLGKPLVVGVIGIIDFITIDESDQVGILLDGTGLTQIRHHRPFVGALFQ